MEHTETKHLERTAWLDLSNEGQHYRMAELNLLAASVIYRNITDLGESGQKAEICRPDRRVRAPGSRLILGEPTSCSLANTGGQNADNGLSVRFYPLPESTRRWFTRSLALNWITPSTMSTFSYSSPPAIDQSCRSISSNRV